jgi:hypothetical protein
MGESQSAEAEGQKGEGQKAPEPLTLCAGPSRAAAALERLDALYGTRGQSARQRLFAQVKARSARFNGYKTRIVAGEDGSGSGARFFKSAQRRIENMRAQQEVLKSRGRANLKLWCGCALLFALFLAWRFFFGPSESEMSLSDLRSRVPMVIDRYTKLTEVSEGQGRLSLTVQKSADAFEGMGPKEIKARLEQWGRNAQGLCTNPLFEKTVNGGKTLRVSLKSADGRVLGTYEVKSCPVSGQGR